MEAATKTVAVKKETIEVQKHPEDQASPRTVIVKTVEGFLAGFVNNTLGKKTRHRNYSVRKEGSVEKLIYTAYRNQYSQQSQMTERNVDGSEELAVRLEGGLSSQMPIAWSGVEPTSLGEGLALPTTARLLLRRFLKRQGLSLCHSAYSSRPSSTFSELEWSRRLLRKL